MHTLMSLGYNYSLLYINNNKRELLIVLEIVSFVMLIVKFVLYLTEIMIAFSALI